MNPTEKLKAFLAAIGAPGSPLAGWAFSAEVIDVWLSAAIKLIGCLGGLASIWWMFHLNRMERLHKLAVMCSDCIAGYPPQGECPVPRHRRPRRCPKL